MEESNNKLGLKIGAGCLGTAVFLILIPVILLGSIVALFTDDAIDDTFDPRQTYAYTEILPTYTEFIEELRADMKTTADSYRKEEETVTDENGNEQTIPGVEAEVEVNEVGFSMVFAWITVLNNEDVLLDESTAETAETSPETEMSAPSDENAEEESGVSQLDQMESLIIPSTFEVKEFLQKCTDIRVLQNGSGYLITNTNKTAEQVVELLYTDEAWKDLFTASYEQYLEFFGETAATGSIDSSNGNYTFIGGTLGEGDGIIPDSGMPIPLYLQGSSTWGSIPYGTDGGNIGNSACGPTSLSMVISYLTGQTVTPPDVVAWAGNTYYKDGVGTTWGLLTDAAEHYGLHGERISGITSVIQALKEGKPCIASMKKGTYFARSAGHFVVLRGLTSDGKILVNDPGGNGLTNLTLSFEPSFIDACAKGYWRYWK